MKSYYALMTACVSIGLFAMFMLTLNFVAPDAHDNILHFFFKHI